jgi:hypothetical protein
MNWVPHSRHVFVFAARLGYLDARVTGDAIDWQFVTALVLLDLVRVSHHS